MGVMTMFQGLWPIWSSNNGPEKISKNSSGIMLDICSGCRIIYIVIDDSNQVKEWTCSTNMTSAFVNDVKNLFTFPCGICRNRLTVSFLYAIWTSKAILFPSRLKRLLILFVSIVWHHTNRIKLTPTLQGNTQANIQKNMRKHLFRPLQRCYKKGFSNECRYGRIGFPTIRLD